MSEELETHISIMRNELASTAATLDHGGGVLSPSFTLGRMSEVIESYLRGAFELGRQAGRRSVEDGPGGAGDSFEGVGKYAIEEPPFPCYHDSDPCI